MKALTKDIVSRIESDFGGLKEKALSLIQLSIRKYEYLNHPRTIRCVLFLAKGKISGLIESLEIAASDPRDVMLYAEYLNPNTNPSIRVRDFNHEFGKEEEDVVE